MRVEVDSIVTAASTGEDFTARPRSMDSPAIIQGPSAVLVTAARQEASPPAGSRASAEASMVAEAFTVVAEVMAAATASSASAKQNDNSRFGE